MSSETPKVRDFTAQARSLPVYVETAPVYELILAMFVWGTKTETMDYDVGSEYFERIEARASKAVMAFGSR